MLHDIAKASAVRDAQRASRFIKSRLNTFTNSNYIRPATTTFLDSVTDSCAGADFTSMANIPLRLAATEALIDTLFEHHDQHHTRKHHRYWLGTVCIDAGVTLLSKPDVDLRPIKRRVDKMMRRHRLHGIYIVEVVILYANGEDAPARLLFHVHMICWRVGEKIHPRKLANDIMKGAGFENCFGARSVTFRRCNMTDDHIAGLGYYASKLPACVERLRPSIRKPGTMRFVHDQAAFSSKLVVRMIEVLSNMRLYDNVRGVGEGAQVRERWKIAVEKWRRKVSRKARGSSQQPASTCDWEGLWRQVGVDGFDRCQISG